VLATTTVLLALSAVLDGAARAQSEVLAGTATTTSGSWSCIGGGVGQQRSASAAFKASGTATGPYPGPFQEAGTVSLHGNYGPLGLGQGEVAFTITSNTATITGTIARNPFYGFIYCGATLTFNTSSASYSATIQAPGRAAQTISGPAQLAGDLSTHPKTPGSVTATLTLP
jgi:hypothetical protein